MTRIITFGTFDVFHIGHVSILERARALGDHLVVGVSSDDLNLRKKGRKPVYSQEHRLRIVGALRCVDEVFLEESLEQKAEYISAHRADVLVMGSDWAGRFDDMRRYCEVRYLERTPSISTTEVIEVVKMIGARPADVQVGAAAIPGRETPPVSSGAPGTVTARTQDAMRAARGEHVSLT